MSGTAAAEEENGFVCLFFSVIASILILELGLLRVPESHLFA